MKTDNSDAIETQILEAFLRALCIRLDKEYEITKRPDKIDRTTPQPDALVKIGDADLAIELTEVESYDGQRRLEAGSEIFFLSRNSNLRMLAKRKKVIVTLPFELFRGTAKKNEERMKALECSIFEKASNILDSDIQRAEFGIEGTNYKAYIAQSLDGVGDLRYSPDKEKLTQAHAQILKKALTDNVDKFANYQNYQKVLVLHSGDYGTHDIWTMRLDYTDLVMDENFPAVDAYDQAWYMRTENNDNCTALIHLKAPREWKANKHFSIDDMDEMEEFLKVAVNCRAKNEPVPDLEEWLSTRTAQNK